MKSGMFAAAVLALAPLAHAQDCGPLNTVIAAGDEGFESVAGEEIDDDVYHATITFFDADECSVDALFGQFYCLWAKPVVADADKAIAPLYDMAKVCLSGGWEWTDMAGQKSGSTGTVMEGYQMRKTSGDYESAIVRVYMDGVAGEPWRQVWLEVE